MFCNNLIKLQLFIILSYEDLTATDSGSCADDFIVYQSTRSLPDSESGKLSKLLV